MGRAAGHDTPSGGAEPADEGDLMRYYSCDSHVVEPRQVFEGLEQQFGSRAPRIERDLKGKPGDWLVLPGTAPVPVGRLGIAGNRLDDPKTDERIAKGYDGPQPRRARPPPAPRRAEGRRHRRRGHVPQPQHVHLRHPRPGGGQGRVRAPQRLGARLLLGRARAAHRHRLPAHPRRRRRPGRDGALGHPGRAGLRHPGPRRPGQALLAPRLRPLLGRRPGVPGAPHHAHLHRHARSTAACPSTGAPRAARSRATRWPTRPR